MTPVPELKSMVTISQGIWLEWRHQPYLRWGTYETSQPDDCAWAASTFVPVDVIYDLLETGPWDSDFGSSYQISSHYVREALLYNDYLHQRANGAVWATDKLKDLCKELGIT